MEHDAPTFCLSCLLIGRYSNLELLASTVRQTQLASDENVGPNPLELRQLADVQAVQVRRAGECFTAGDQGIHTRIRLAGEKELDITTSSSFCPF